MRMVLLAIVMIGCESLQLMPCPSLTEQVAARAAEKKDGCWKAAVRVVKALDNLNYANVQLCVGLVRPEHDELHAWVEVVEKSDIYILDPYRPFGEYKMSRWSLPENIYVTHITYNIYSVELYEEGVPRLNTRH